jgi:hypothetical protein
MAGKAWFRMSTFSCMPVTWQGWVVTAVPATLVVAVALVMISS